MTNRKLQIALYLGLMTATCSETFAAELMDPRSAELSIQKQNINVSVQLSGHGELIKEVKTQVLEGATFSYSLLEQQAWPGSTAGTEIGFEMELTPFVTNNGSIQYTLKARQREFMESEVKRSGVDLPPTVEDDSIVITSVAKPGIPVDIPFGFNTAMKKSKYVLKIIANIVAPE